VVDPPGDASYWDDIDPVWRECFELAWESFRHHSIPVGAVLVDPHGAVVARGRNRRSERTAPSGQIAGSNLAHAEINALAGLPPGDYSAHVLHTTLEPCFLCTAAIRHSHIGVVRFAAPDPAWAGIERLPTLNPTFARRWPRRDGPLGGPLQRLAVILHLVSSLERGADAVVDCHQELSPDLVRLARGLVGARAHELRSMSFAEAVELLSQYRSGT